MNKYIFLNKFTGKIYNSVFKLDTVNKLSDSLTELLGYVNYSIWESSIEIVFNSTNSALDLIDNMTDSPITDSIKSNYYMW